MDFLRAAIKEQQEQKKTIESKLNIPKGKKKYIRRGEIDEILEEQQREAQEKEEQLRRKRLRAKKDTNVKKKKQRKTEETEDCSPGDKEDGLMEMEPLLPIKQVQNSLRQLGQPITVFGEDARTRQERLRKAQHDSVANQHDMGVTEGHDIRNQFLEKSTTDKQEEDEEEEEKAQEQDEEELTDARRVYKFFRGLMKSWQQDLLDRPENVKRSAQGKMATKTMKQCKDYIRPLYTMCKTESVPSNILPNLVNIVNFCEQGEFVRANDSYIALAIGNAAWPIGVTMVGIHERTGREKIHSNKQAHVMNNEVQRKYLTSVKRLITYCQSKSTVLPSKRVT